MGGRRGIAALIAGLIVVAACGIGALLLVRSTLDDAIKVLGLVGTTLGVLTVVWAVLNWLWRHGRPDEVHRPTAEQIDELATTVRNQWKNEANRRKLLAPAPLPIRWALAAAELRGSVDGVIGVPGQPRRFSPVPGLQDVTKQMLRAGGGQTDLHHIYGGVASGRLVITGEPGAGKTAAAIMLLLDALAHRTRLSEVERAQVPVPVMFTLADWDPNVVSFEAWIAETLAATYYSGNAGRQQARMLVDDCRVAAIVDGLDEINADLRPVALEAMSAAKIRVVLLSRSEELTIAAREHRLMDAAVLELCPVGAAEAADYLQRSLPGQPPAHWDDLLHRLRANPDSTLANSLRTALALTLVRDTYRAGDDLSALLDAPDSAEPSAIEDQLLGRIVSAAYTRPPGERHPAYGIDVADRTLSFFAEHMSRDGTTDLAWWHLHRWAPTSRRLLARSLPVGLVIVISGFLPEKYATAVITIALLVGVLAMGGLGYRLRGRGPQRMDRVRWRAIVSWRTFGVGLTFGFLFWFMALSIYEVFDSREVVYEPLAIGLASGLIFAFVAGIAQPGTGVTTSVTPVSTWRADQRVALLFGLAFGLALATVFTVVGLLTLGYTEASGALPWYVFIPLAVGLVALLGLLAATLGWLWSIAMTTRLAFAQFAISHHLPIRLMNFLEDARDRDVLRTVGPVYQFRHARLQDHLALKQGIAFGRPPTIQGSVRPERDKLAGPALRNSILGLIIPFVLLVYAWVQANDSLRAIRASGGRLTGERIARLARTISIIGLVIQGLLIGLGNVIARAA